MSGFFIRALDSINKEERLLSSCHDICVQKKNKSVFFADNQNFEKIPGQPLAYWCTPSFFDLFKKNDNFAGDGRGAYVGLQTSDDFRFARLNWEIVPDSLNDKWFLFAKGGEYQPYYSDIHLCVNWQKDGFQIKNYRNASGKLLSRPQNISHYLKPGITWPERTTSGFCPQILPRNVIFSQVGLAMFINNKNEMLGWVLALHTRVYQYVVELLIGLGEETVSGSAGRHYTSGMVSKFPYLRFEHDEMLSEFLNLYNSSSFSFSLEENNELFNPEFFISSNTIEEIFYNIEKRRDFLLELALNSSANIEKEVRAKLNISNNDLDDAFNVVGPHPVLDLKENDKVAFSAVEKSSNISTEKIIENALSLGAVGRYITKKSFFVDRDIEVISIAYNVNAQSVRLANKRSGYPISLLSYKEISMRIVSYLVGCSFGRFNKTSTSVKKEIDVFDGRNPFENIQVNKLPFKAFSADENTCLLTDEVFINAKKLYGDEFYILSEICSEIDIPSVNLMFKNPNVFFDFHLSQYSKSRRQAPIYWPLQTPSGSYTLWIYYHSLNKQTLYSCVNCFIEPKLDSITEDLNRLHSKTARSTQEDKELIELTDLEAELKDFRDEFLRLAKFWNPNLDDGVQVSAAPLWKLFQHKAWQRRLKDTWEKLEEGDYDWAHLACSIWPERVLRKCHQDRSLAIAHDVEDIFWHEVEVPVKRGKKLTGEMKIEWQPKSLTEAELTELINQTITDLK